MKPAYIIVQAGGKGTRMGHVTANKPKALTPVDNLPMLFHLFRKYPDSRYIIIGDYKFDVLRRYLAAFADVDYRLIQATGYSGTCAGMSKAAHMVPDNTPFMLIWCDLILPKDFELPDEPGDYIGVARDFPCRWRYEQGVFAEERSDTAGVAGLFAFHDAQLLRTAPEDGELVRWLAGTGAAFEEMPLYRVKEYGLLSEYEKLGSARCRPFNRIHVEGDRFIKEAIDAQGRALAARETAWYRRIEGQGFANIPRIYGYEPLEMERIDGMSVYEYEDLTKEQKSLILQQIVKCLKGVQSLESAPADRASFDDAYVDKTFKRLEKVWDLVPFGRDETVTVNGRRCRNALYCRAEIERALKAYMPKLFRLIHGDCTFSNVMLRADGTPVLIDPRGYFGLTELYGDPGYDWAKLYYSIVGNYDQFNRKRFRLTIAEDGVQLSVRSNGWEDMEDEFFKLLDGEVTRAQIRLLHAIIWLSLTTYAWEDYDSVCGAFYMGLYYLEEALNESVL